MSRFPLVAGDALSRRWLDAWTLATPEGFGDCCAVAVHYEDPLLGEPVDGLAALADHAAAVRRALPDARLEAIGAPVVDGALGCLPWRALGTHRGQVGGIPATGRFVVVPGVHYIELADGLITRARGFFDLYDAAVQLGLLPRRGSLAETAVLMVRGYGLRPRA